MHAATTYAQSLDMYGITNFRLSFTTIQEPSSDTLSMDGIHIQDVQNKASRTEVSVPDSIACRVMGRHYRLIQR